MPASTCAQINTQPDNLWVCCRRLSGETWPFCHCREWCDNTDIPVFKYLHSTLICIKRIQTSNIQTHRNIWAAFYQEFRIGVQQFHCILCHNYRNSVDVAQTFQDLPFSQYMQFCWLKHAVNLNTWDVIRFRTGFLAYGYTSECRISRGLQAPDEAQFCIFFHPWLHNHLLGKSQVRPMKLIWRTE